MPASGRAQRGGTGSRRRDAARDRPGGDRSATGGMPPARSPTICSAAPTFLARAARRPRRRAASAGRQALLGEAGGERRVDLARHRRSDRRIAEENQSLAAVEDDAVHAPREVARAGRRSARPSTRRPRPSGCAPTAVSGRAGDRGRHADRGRAAPEPARRAGREGILMAMTAISRACGAGVALVLTLTAVGAAAARPPCSIPRPSRSTTACRWWW